MEEGIDPEFLAALPPELQAEVMEQQVREAPLLRACQQGPSPGGGGEGGRQGRRGGNGVLPLPPRSSTAGIATCGPFASPFACSGASVGFARPSGAASSRQPPQPQPRLPLLLLPLPLLLLVLPVAPRLRTAPRRRQGVLHLAALQRALLVRRARQAGTWTLPPCWPRSPRMCGRRCCWGESWLLPPSFLCFPYALCRPHLLRFLSMLMVWTCFTAASLLHTACGSLSWALVEDACLAQSRCVNCHSHLTLLCFSSPPEQCRRSPAGHPASRRHGGGPGVAGGPCFPPARLPTAPENVLCTSKRLTNMLAACLGLRLRLLAQPSALPLVQYPACCLTPTPAPRRACSGTWRATRR